MAKTDKELRVEYKLINAEFNKGIKDINADVKTLNKEFKLQQTEMQNSASQTDKYKASIENLGRQLEFAEKKTQETNKAYQNAKNLLGENSKEAQAWKDKLLDAQRNEAHLRNSIEDTNNALNNHVKSIAGAKAEAAAHSAELEKQNSSLNQWGEKLQGVGDKIGNIGNKMSVGFTAPVVAGLYAATEGTEDYRRSLGMLDQTANEAKIGQDAVNEALNTAVAVSGDADASFEAISNLMQTGFGDNQMLQALEGLSGAVTKFPDTLKLEGLADGLQETLATGSAIGPFAEMLERSGVNLDTFNEGLAQARQNGEETNYILQTLSDLGLNETYNAFKQNNEALFENAAATNDTKQAMADLGNTIQPILTTVNGLIADVAGGFNNLDGGVQKAIIGFVGIVAALGPIMSVLGPIVTGIGTFASAAATAGGVGALLAAKFIALKTGVMALIAPITSIAGVLGGPLTIGIAAAVAAGVALYKNWDTVKVYAINIWNALKSFFVSTFEVIKSVFSEAFEFISNVVKKYIEIVKAVITTVFNAIKTYFTTVINVYKTIFTTGFNLIKNTITSIFNAVKNTITSIWNSIKSTITNVVNGIKTTVSNTFNSVKSAITNPITSAKNTVLSTFESIKNGISSKITAAKNTVSRMIDSIKSKFNFSWKLPKISLPKISITTTKGLLGIPIPKFRIKWNAKGALFTKPTIGGVNNGVLQGFGEAGPEAAIPLTKSVLGDIGAGIVNATRDLVDSVQNTSGNVYVTMNNVISSDYDSNRAIRQLDEGLGRLGVRRQRARGVQA